MNRQLSHTEIERLIDEQEREFDILFPETLSAEKGVDPGCAPSPGLRSPLGKCLQWLRTRLPFVGERARRQ